eukprot:Colp12_sorted_trinity150504_noHs@23972
MLEILLPMAAAMGIGSYLAGSLPLFLRLSEESLDLVSKFGAGLLVGTALVVIIPEGVHALMSTSGEATHEAARRSILHAEGTGEEHESGAGMGAAMVLGFAFMLLIDQIGSHSHKKTPGDAENGTNGDAHRSVKTKITATIGLIVHAAADGIALGAAVASSQTALSFIVFLAIMLHKAPASFGLTSYLLHTNSDAKTVRKYLMAFAAAAPLGAVLTYAILSGGIIVLENTSHSTGLALLFSAGTFLYVATIHVLPEAQHEHSGYKGALATIIGLIMPLFLNIGHEH